MAKDLSASSLMVPNVNGTPNVNPNPLLLSFNADPTLQGSGVTAPVGSVGIRTDATVALYIKFGTGDNDWVQVFPNRSSGFLGYDAVFSQSIGTGFTKDWDPTGSVGLGQNTLVLLTANTGSITGMSGGVAGKTVTICLTPGSTNGFNIVNQGDTTWDPTNGSASGNLFLGWAVESPGDFDTIVRGGSVTFYYDGSVWRPISCCGSA